METAEFSDHSLFGRATFLSFKVIQQSLEAISLVTNSF